MVSFSCITPLLLLLFNCSSISARKEKKREDTPYRPFRQQLRNGHSDTANSNDVNLSARASVHGTPTAKPTRRPRPIRYDAVIVGAGWAGIKAAKTLMDEGITNILVLEANDYVGGRSKTANADGSINVPIHNNITHAPIDMGSEWLYMNTDMEEYMRDNGYLNAIDLNKGKTSFQPMKDSAFYMQTIRANGKVVAKRMGKNVLSSLYERVWEGFLAFRDDLLRKEGDQSYFTAAEKYKKKFSHWRPIQYINLILAAASVEYTGKPEELSLYEHTIYDGDMGNQHYISVSRLGFGNLAATFAESFSSKIKLNAKVTAINYQNSRKAIVSYTSDGVETRIFANTVLVTASLGVLKAGTINFIPPLPAWKQDAIDNMGFGVVNKVSMQWNDKNAIVWPDDEWMEVITPDAESSGRWTTFFNPTEDKGIPTLIGWVGGQEAIDVQSQTDEEILADVMKNLESMFPSITRPDRVIITRWGQEPHILGTYCFKKVGRDFSDDTWYLGENVDKVWFAGEATTSSSYGTAHGAWKTGMRAARDMIEELRRKV